MSADFATETLQARREWHHMFKGMKGKNLQPRTDYPARLSVRFDGETKSFQSKQKVKNSAPLSQKEESEKVGLKLNIQKTKIMASGAITSWKINGQTVEAVSDFILGAPKSLQMVIAAMKLKDTYSLEGKL